MTEVLTRLVALKKIRVVRCGGNPTMYYIPTAEQLDAEARLQAKAAEPICLVKAESEREKARKELGFGMIRMTK
jgi:hypothetical protein